MSTDTTTTEEPATSAPDTDTDDGGDTSSNGDTPPDPAELDKWKSLARKHEEQAKKNAEAAKRLSELEASQKTEQEKLTDRLTELESTARSSTLEAARLRVALRKGLTETQAKRLVGETVEELESDADELLESFKTPASALPRKPTERLRGGAEPEAGLEETDPAKLADQIRAARGGV